MITKFVDTPDNRAELFEFYRRVYPKVLTADNVPYLTNDKHFEWMLKGTDILLYRDVGGSIIGHCWVRYEDMVMEDKPFTGSYITDIFVDPDCQQRGIGSKFIRYIRDNDQVIMGVGMTDPAERLYRKNGITILNEGHLFGMMFKPKRCLEATGNVGLKAMLARWPLKLMSYSHILPGSPVPKGWLCDWIALSLNWDVLWNFHLWDVPIRTSRTVEMLNHKRNITHSSCPTFVLLTGYRVPMGYIICRVSKKPGLRIGKIVDMVVDPCDAVRNARILLKQATNYLWDANVDGIFCIASDQRIKRALMWAGMMPLRRQKAMTSIPQKKIDQVRRKGRCVWYNTFLDADMDMYW